MTQHPHPHITPAPGNALAPNHAAVPDIPFRGNQADGPRDVNVDNLLTDMWTHNGPERAVELLERVNGSTVRLLAGSVVRDGDQVFGPYNHPVTLQFRMSPKGASRMVTTLIADGEKPLSSHTRFVDEGELNSPEVPFSLLSPTGQQERLDALNAADEADAQATPSRRTPPKGFLGRLRAIGR